MNQFLDMHRGVVESWWQHCVLLTIQASLVAGLMLLVVRIGKRWPAPLRYWILVLALIKFAIFPLFAFPTGFFSSVRMPQQIAGALSIELPAYATAKRSASTEDNTPVSASSDARPSEAQSRSNLLAVSDAQTRNEPEFALLTEEPTEAVSEPFELSGPLSAAGASIEQNTDGSRRESWGPWPWKFILMTIHLGGIMLFGIRTIAQVFALHSAACRGIAIAHGDLHDRLVRLCQSLQVSRIPRLLLLPNCQGPISFGIVRPTIALPPSMSQLSGKDVDTVLAHELAHHSRRDLLVNWLQVAMGILWWFNPVLWILNRQLRKTREDCCDDLLLSRGVTTADAYCGTLLRVASVLAGRDRPAVAIAMCGTVHPLGERMCRIMDATIHRTTRVSATGIVALVVVAGTALPGMSLTGSQLTLLEARRERVAELPVVATTPNNASNEIDSNAAQATASGANQTPAGLPASREEPSLPLHGVIVDDSSQPVHGAELWLTREDWMRWMLDPAPTVLSKSKSNERGQFDIEIPAQMDIDGPRATVALWAYAPGSSLAVQSITGETLPDAGGLALTLRKAIPQRLRVVDVSENPVADAVVQIVNVARIGWLRPPAELGDRLSVRSGPEGWAEVSAVNLKEVPRLRVTAPNLGVQSVQGADTQTLGPWDRVVLQPVGRIGGNLTCADPARVQGLTFRIHTSYRSSPNGAAGGFWTSGEFEVTTDKDGRFDIAQAPIGTGNITVEYSAKHPFRTKLPKELLVEAGRTSELNLELVRAVPVRGRVVDSENGEPVSGARVEVVPDGWYERQPMATDADGFFEGYCLPGTYTDWVNPPEGYRNLDRAAKRVAGTAGKILVPDDVAEFELPTMRVTKTVTLHGRVLDEHEHPVSRAIVHADWLDHAVGEWRKRSLATDADGEFAIDRLPRDTDVRITATRQGAYPEAPVIVRAIRKDPVTVRISPEFGSTLIGRVTDTENRPVPGALVTIVAKTNDVAGLVTHDIEPEFGGRKELVTDADGRFRTPPVGRYYRFGFKVSAEGFAPGTAGSISPAKASSEVDLGTLRVARSAAVTDAVRPRADAPKAVPANKATANDPPSRSTPAAAIAKKDHAFTVLDVHEQPIAGATIAVRPKNSGSAGGPLQEAVTDELGKVMFTGVPKDDLYFQIAHTDYRPASLIVGATMTETTWHLAPKTRGVVRDEDGRALHDIQVAHSLTYRNDGVPIASGLGSPPHYEWTDSGGRFEFKNEMGIRGKPLRPVFVIAVDEGAEHMAVQLFPADELDRSLELRMQPTCVVRAQFEFKGVNREDLRYFSVRITDKDGNDIGQQSATFSDTGDPIAETVVRLPPGSYQLAYRQTKQTTAMTIPFDVQAGAKELDLGMRTANVSTVVSLRGQPAPELAIDAWRPGAPKRLADLRGKVIVLDFWGHWCLPCLYQMPELMDIAKRFRGEPVEWIAIHTPGVNGFDDLDAKLADARERIWKGQDIPFVTVIDQRAGEEDRKGITGTRYGIEGWPTLIVIDRMGNVVGSIEKDRLEERLRQLLAQ
jgi:beta-lactamase regulating signal transducer with metallopeptidase domain/thiol-disulfide isomerase/thioredoxin/protocatechuate 3,4-dioxygenase beta subunit